MFVTMNHSEAGLTWRIPVTVSLSVNQHTEWALRFIAFSAATVILIGIITSKRIYDRDGREPPVYPYTVPCRLGRQALLVMTDITFSPWPYISFLEKLRSPHYSGTVGIHISCPRTC